MTGNDKLKELLEKGAVVECKLGKKLTRAEEKELRRIEKERQEQVYQRWKDAIIERCTDGDDEILKNDNDIIYSLSTLIYDTGTNDMDDLLPVIKKMYPKIYVKILEAFVSGYYDT